MGMSRVSFGHIFKNPWVGHFFKALMSVLLVVYVLQAVHPADLKVAFARANLFGFSVSTLLVLLGVVYLQAVEIFYSMRGASKISIAELCKINLALMFYTLFLPSAATFFIRHAKYIKAGYGGYDSATLVGFHKLLQLTVACVAGFVTLCVVYDKVGSFGPVLFAILLALCVAFALAVALVLSGKGVSFAQWCAGVIGLRRLAIRPDPSAASRQPAGGRVRKAGGLIVTTSQKVLSSLQSFSTMDRRQLNLVLMCTLLQHVFIVLSAYTVMQMITPGVPVVAVIFVRSLIVVLLSFPVSIGGVGVREFAFYKLFPLFGVSAEDAIASSLILFGVQIVVAGLGAAVECFDMLKASFGKPSIAQAKEVDSI
jgi:uncharacterized membrane protein YbhN (UPF0104 family)